MNIRCRDFSLLGYTMAISKQLSESSNKKLKWRAEKIDEICREITAVYPGGVIQKNTLKNINKNVIRIIEKNGYIGKGEKEKEKDNAVVAFSFILCILDKIFEKSKNKKMVDLFDVLNKRVFWINGFFDPKLNKENCYMKGEQIYNNWIMEK